MSDGQTPRLSTSFAFIDSTDPKNLKSKETRRLIHQHSMKDVGRSRRKPKGKPQGIDLDTSALQISKPVAAERKFTPNPSWWLGTSGIDPFLRLPVELNSFGRELVSLSMYLSLKQVVD